jgi:hypothetical protein
MLTCEQPLNTLVHCAACNVACSRSNAAASCTTGTCTLGACNVNFGNCDGDASNGCEQSTITNAHCGGCGVSCSRANATASCGTGTCTLGTCNPGYGNCDGNAANGCEAPLNTTTNCGACNTTCDLTNAGESCVTGTCALGTCNAGFGDCDSVASNGCETPLTSTTNCNACNALCDYVGATETCPSGTCTFGTCTAGLGNCDSILSNGCEQALTSTTHCGGCNVACSRSNATASCGTGTCTLGTCNAGFGSCDSITTNGCEAPLTSLTNCGGCNVACARTNAAESCATGTCTLGVCDPGFGDCDTVGSNGCEAPLTSLTNCGGCTVACARANAAESCATGTCTLGACDLGFGDCDTLGSTGCEAPLTTLTNCGGCNVACARTNAAESCATGTCTLGVCDAGFGNCDTNPANGCETALNSNSNCGACGTVCDVAGGKSCNGTSCVLTSCPAGTADCDNDGLTCEQSLYTLSSCGGCNIACARANAAESCPAGTCLLGACDPNFANCDTDPSNGCEQATTSLVHCGGCNVACARTNAAESCATGSCVLGACDPGFGNCDSMAANGCELATNTLTDCGGCGTACALANAAESCATGSCVLGACTAGFGNCDSLASTGCEAPLTTTANCNGCGVVCDFPGASETCPAGTCTFGTCTAGFGNCDTNLPNGCEQALTNNTHCGGCNVSCARTNATASCATGTCTLGTCNAGYASCDSNTANGCEIDTYTTANCGGCANLAQNQACTALPNVMQSSCGGGVCSVDVCNSGFANCDGVVANGCEHVGATCCTSHQLPPSVNVDVTQWSAAFLTSPIWNCNAAGTTTINSTAGTITSTSCALGTLDFTNNVPQLGGAPNVMVVRLRGLTVSTGHIIKLVGDKPVIFLVEGNVVVDSGGLIDAGAVLNVAGAGGSIATLCVGSTAGDNGTYPHVGGAGGGGFGTGGGTGANKNGINGYGGGGPTADQDLMPLRGGCSGGKGGGSAPVGVGGGAVEISASGTITLGSPSTTGSISAAGGGASSTPSGNTHGGSGAGSGGGVLLVSPATPTFYGASAVRAHGGGGGGGAASGAAAVAGANGASANDLAAAAGVAAGNTGNAGGIGATAYWGSAGSATISGSGGNAPFSGTAGSTTLSRGAGGGGTGIVIVMTGATTAACN